MLSCTLVRRRSDSISLRGVLQKLPSSRCRRQNGLTPHDTRGSRNDCHSRTGFVSTKRSHVRTATLQRIDAIDGIIPEIERLKVQRRHEETQPVPMFVLPEGARISVTVNQAALRASAGQPRTDRSHSCNVGAKEGSVFIGIAFGNCFSSVRGL